MRESAFRIARTAAREIKKQSVDQMVDQIMALPEGTRLQLLAPVVRGRKGRHAEGAGTRSEKRLCESPH